MDDQFKEDHLVGMIHDIRAEFVAQAHVYEIFSNNIDTSLYPYLT